jgi:hypothetical protein
VYAYDGKKTKLALEELGCKERNFIQVAEEAVQSLLTSSVFFIFVSFRHDMRVYVMLIECK